MERMEVRFGSVIQMYPGGGPQELWTTTAKDPSADLKESDMAAETEAEVKTEAEQKGSPEEQSMETNSGAHGSLVPKKEEEEEKRREAKSSWPCSSSSPPPGLLWSTPNTKSVLLSATQNSRKQGGTVNLKLTDYWLRHYQVLPNRTHPVLLMSGGGGYLLSGTTVAAERSKPAASRRDEEPAAKRQKVTETEG
ncbi:hypothetical protein KUCAC02_019820 [Chaenocephalus aceratus]|uniref:Uncharacterized protein n=1 Tax=Chaenocephalus aceratus TaxID=36190 RepID=A0ACB9VQX5_CHAAC|nr:hypothetical protein KUCAC02_019820 [Chaenocephalus aceratus]